MSKVEKTSLDVLSELWAIADEVGHDHVYEGEEWGCSYVKRTYDPLSGAGVVTPGCIVGHWLHRNGVSISTLESNEGSIMNKWYETYGHSVNFDMTKTAVEFLAHVQSAQDSEVPWGRAIQEAAMDFGLIEDEEE